MPLGPAVSVYSSIRCPVYLKPHCPLVPSRPWTRGTEPVHMETTVVLVCHYRVYAIAPPMLVTGWVMLQDGEFWWCKHLSMRMRNLNLDGVDVGCRPCSQAWGKWCCDWCLCNWRSCQRPSNLLLSSLTMIKWNVMSFSSSRSFLLARLMFHHLLLQQ